MYNLARSPETYHMKKKKPVTSAGYFSKNPTLAPLRRKSVMNIRNYRNGVVLACRKNRNVKSPAALRRGEARPDALPLHHRRSHTSRRSFQQYGRSELPSPYQVPTVAHSTGELHGGDAAVSGEPGRRLQGKS